MGKSGSGKTTVAKLVEARGFFRASLDDIAKGLTESVLPDIAREFGSGYIVDGLLDRKALGARVFSDPEALRRLNGIFADPIWDALRDIMKAHENVVVDGFDLPSGLDPDILLYVHAPTEVLLARLIPREPWTPLQVLRDRLQRQESLVVPQCRLRVDVNTATLHGEALEEFLGIAIPNLQKV